jgi:hypothetical protein
MCSIQPPTSTDRSAHCGAIATPADFAVGSQRYSSAAIIASENR